MKERAEPSPQPPLELEDRWITVQEVMRITGFARTTIWRVQQEDPDFPAPIEFNATTKRWRLKDVLVWKRKKERELLGVNPVAEWGYRLGDEDG